jgi:hypothetical protein
MLGNIPLNKTEQMVSRNNIFLPKGFSGVISPKPIVVKDTKLK